MSRYRRADTPGAAYFFTVVTCRRRGFLCDTDVRIAVREAITRVRGQYPFFIDAWVLLPDHLHTIWTLSSVMDERFQNQTSGINALATTLLGTPNPQ
jgi:REP element-mobilizing transposase RayT